MLALFIQSIGKDSLSISIARLLSPSDFQVFRPNKSAPARQFGLPRLQIHMDDDDDSSSIEIGE